MASAPALIVDSVVITAEVPTILDFTFFGGNGTDLLAIKLAAAGALKLCSTGSDSIPFFKPTIFSGIAVPDKSLSKSILHNAFEPEIFPKSLSESKIPSFGATR